MKTVSKKISFADVDIKIAKDYSCEDADVTYKLTNHLNKILKKEKDLKKIDKVWSNSQYSIVDDIYSFQPARDYFLQCVSGESNVVASEEWFENWLSNKYFKENL